MKKEFLPYDTVRDNALKLARRIYSEGFLPDVIYGNAGVSACDMKARERRKQEKPFEMTS
jgi:hypothetical protein